MKSHKLTRKCETELRKHVWKGTKYDLKRLESISERETERKMVSMG